MDLYDDASMSAGVDRILDETGRIDVLVNNAGYGQYGSVEDTPLDEARRQFAVEGLSDSLRVELRPFGIDVVLIEPGPVITEWNATARANLLETSAGTAYADQARSVARALRIGDRPGLGSEPVVVARKIVRAATSTRPRSRYPVGRGAGTIVRARRVLPDRALDAVINRIYLR